LLDRQPDKLFYEIVDLSIMWLALIYTPLYELVLVVVYSSPQLVFISLRYL